LSNEERQSRENLRFSDADECKSSQDLPGRSGSKALPGRKLQYTNWLNLRQLLEPSGREMACGSEDFGLKMTQSEP
jgi:hypothetical protein